MSRAPSSHPHAIAEAIRQYGLLEKRQAAFREACQGQHLDRNQRAGDLYEQQKSLNDAVAALVRAEYAATWAERWPI